MTLNFQCRQPNRTTMARTLNLALLLGHPIHDEPFRTLKFFQSSYVDVLLHIMTKNLYWRFTRLILFCGLCRHSYSIF